MDVYDRIYKDLQRVDIYEMFFDFVNDNQKYITGLNKERLFKFGTDIEGNELRTYRAEQGEVYNRFTIDVKMRKGQPDDRVTLFDTGKFYNTFRAEANRDKLSISADTKKPDGDITDNVNVESALGIEDLEPLEDKFAEYAVNNILDIVNL